MLSLQFYNFSETVEEEVISQENDQGNNLDDNNTVSSAYSPCPSDCWSLELDPTDGTKSCKLKNDCQSVSCNANDITIRYSPTLFGEETSKLRSSGNALASIDESSGALGMILVCKLDGSSDCGTRYDVVQDK